MSRLGSGGITVIASSLICLCFGCGGGVSTAPSPVVTPAIVALSPQPDASLETGGVLSFSAQAQDSGANPITPSPLISFVSSNPSVVQVAASGLACAGKWDSLTNPQICTPGPVGTAVVNAVSAGVSSAPATVHVHQHIDSIVVTPVPGQTPTPPPLPDNVCSQPVPVFNTCFSKTKTFNYQAAACNRGNDITSSVGPFNWGAFNQSVATVSTTATGLLIGQSQVTAVNPGMTNIFAAVAGVNSPPVQFTTCPVKSISLTVGNTTQTSFIEASGTQSLTTTVVDSTDTEITGVPLTWSTSDAAAFTASGTSTGSAAAVKPGSATIIASCLPPNCNIGFSPSRAIYPENVITATATGTGTAQNTTLWLASTECGVLNPTTQVVTNSDDCISTIVPIDTATGITGAGTNLPVVPNSIQFDRQGSKAYLGTNSGRLGTVGLSIVTPASTSSAATTASLPSAPGKVLAISPDGKNVIVSDTVDTPNQVFVVTSSATAASLPITGATAADFAPDSSKAYIVAGNNLYVYSPTEALKKITYTDPVRSVTFLADGAFAYLAGGSAPKQITVLKTCDNQPAFDDDHNSQDIPSPSIPALTAVPIFLKASSDNKRIFAFNTSGIDFIDVTTMGKPFPTATVSATAAGCEPPAPSATPPLPGGLPTVINEFKPQLSSFNFGQGTFTPTQFIVASSGTRAYILASDLSNIIILNSDSQPPSSIQLSGNSVPLRASLSTDGKTVYVLARDTVTKVNSIHVIDTTINTDINQILLSQSLCHPRTGVGGTFTCNADLIAVRP